MDNDALFEAADALAASLEAGGNSEAAATLREGKAMLNGLTDGWALFAEAMDAVLDSHGARLSASDTKTLCSLRKAVRRRVSGRNR